MCIVVMVCCMFLGLWWFLWVLDYYYCFVFLIRYGVGGLRSGCLCLGDSMVNCGWWLIVLEVLIWGDKIFI